MKARGFMMMDKSQYLTRAHIRNHQFVLKTFKY